MAHLTHITGNAPASARLFSHTSTAGLSGLSVCLLLSRSGSVSVDRCLLLSEMLQVNATRLSSSLTLQMMRVHLSARCRRCLLSEVCLWVWSVSEVFLWCWMLELKAYWSISTQSQSISGLMLLCGSWSCWIYGSLEIQKCSWGYIIGHISALVVDIILRALTNRCIEPKNIKKVLVWYHRNPEGFCYDFKMFYDIMGG